MTRVRESRKQRSLRLGRIRHSRKLRSFRLGRIAVLVVTLVLVGCGGTTPREETTAEPAHTTTATEVSTNGEPAPGPEVPPGLEGIVLLEAPHPEHVLRTELGTCIRIVGYDAGAQELTEGAAGVAVTIYWEVRCEVGEGWRTLFHLVDADGASRMNFDDGDPLTHTHPASAWAPGTWVRNTIEVRVLSGFGSPTATLYAGLWSGPDRMPIVVGPHDDAERTPVVSFSVRAP